MILYDHLILKLQSRQIVKVMLKEVNEGVKLLNRRAETAKLLQENLTQHEQLNSIRFITDKVEDHLYEAVRTTHPELKPVLEELKKIGAIFATLAYIHEAEGKQTVSTARVTEQIVELETKLKETRCETTLLTEILTVLENYFTQVKGNLNRQVYYKALENEAEKEGYKAEGPIVVVTRLRGDLFNTSMRLQSIYSENRQAESVIAILPYNRYKEVLRSKTSDVEDLNEGYIEGKYAFWRTRGVDQSRDAQSIRELEPISEHLLKPENAMLLKTALQLYSETPELTFEKSVELAEKL